MNAKYLTACSALALLITLSGCGDSGSTGNNTTPTAPTPTTTPATLPVDNTVAPATMPAMNAPVAPPMAAATPTTAPAASDMAMAKSTADDLITKGIQYVKDNKLDLASQTVDKLEGMKGSLPADYGTKIDQLKTMLDAAKLGSGKMPSGMKMPGM